MTFLSISANNEIGKYCLYAWQLDIKISITTGERTDMRGQLVPCATSIYCRVFQPWQYWYLGSNNSLGGHSVHCRVSLAAPLTSTHQKHPIVVTTKNISRHCLTSLRNIFPTSCWETILLCAGTAQSLGSGQNQTLNEIISDNDKCFREIGCRINCKSPERGKRTWLLLRRIWLGRCGW